MGHESFERREEIHGSSSLVLGLVFAAVFLIIGVLPRFFGHELRLWALIVTAVFFAVALALPRLLFSEHHLSHAASAFFASPLDEAAVLTMDGVGEWTTTSLAHSKGNTLEVSREIHFPHSVGLLHSAFTIRTEETRVLRPSALRKRSPSHEISKSTAQRGNGVETAFSGDTASST